MSIQTPNFGLHQIEHNPAGNDDGVTDIYNNHNSDMTAIDLALARLPMQDFYRTNPFKYKGPEIAANRITIVPPSYSVVRIGDSYQDVFSLINPSSLLLSNSAVWDSLAIDYTAAANRAGKDFNIWAIKPESGNTFSLKLSDSPIAPVGYNRLESQLLGGFHCMCATPANLPEGHTLKYFTVGDIVPRSVWDQNFRPVSNPAGMVYAGITDLDDFGGVPIWVDIYLASGDGTVPTSRFGATILDTVNWYSMCAVGYKQNKRLLWRHEFVPCAIGCEERIAAASDPGTVTAIINTNGRSILSYIGCWGIIGTIQQMVLDTGYMLEGMPSTGDPTWVAFDQGAGRCTQQGTRGNWTVVNCGCRYGQTDSGSRSFDSSTTNITTTAYIGGRFAAWHHSR